MQTVIFIKKLIKNTLKLNKSSCIYLNNLFNHQFHPLKSYIPKQTYGNMKELYIEEFVFRKMHKLNEKIPGERMELMIKRLFNYMQRFYLVLMYF